MKLRNVKSVIAFLAICSLFFTNSIYAATVVTPATGGTCLNVTPGAYKVLSNIVITEAAVTDISTGAGLTFILAAPAGFEFRPVTGNVVFTAGRDISSATIVVTNTTITVTLNVPTNANLDAFRIRNIEMRSLVPYATGSVVRPIAGGTAVIAGDAPGAGVNHASLTTTGSGGTFTTISNGNWSSGATWSGGISPSCNDNVVIGHQINVDATVGVNDVTINTGGNLISDNSVTVSGNFVMAGTGVYTHNNLLSAATTIFAGAENIAPTSKIIVNKWMSFLVPLATGVTGDFGAIEINTTGTWNQAGTFAPARVKGTLTINGGAVTMDDGTGMTTALTLQDVVISGSGRFVAQSGTPRNLTITTGNFTDNSTTTAYTYLMFRAVGNLVWNVNGNLTLSHRLMMIEGLTAAEVGSATVHVTGNMSVTGGLFYGVRNITGGINMTVDGTSTITGNPTLVVFKDNFAGDVTFNSGNMTIDSGVNNYFTRGNSTIGAVDVNITGNLNVTGNTTRLYIGTGTANTSAVTLEVSNDLTLTGAQLYTSSSPGSVMVSVGRNFTQAGTTSMFYGQRLATATGTSNILVSGTLAVSDGLFVQSSGVGTIDLDVVEALSIQNATFYGMNNATAGNNGSASLDVSDLDIAGSNFFLHRGEITDGRTINVNILNQMTINFTSSSQQVFFINRASNNNALLNLNIGTNLFTTGSGNGLFCTSMSEGAETVTIGGDVSVGAGRVRFNAYEGVTARGHAVNGTISGSLLISGGSISLSSNRFAATWNIAGDYDQTAGYAVYKWYHGPATINVQGNYSVTGGSVHFYSRPTTATPDPVTLTIYGNATFENATTVFDSCLTSTAIHKMIFKGANVTFGSNVVFTHISHLSTRTVFGSMIYDRAGAIVLKRNASSFDIRQVKQIITGGTTVDFTTSPFDLMIASHSSAVSTVNTTLDINGTLDMGTMMIAARNQTNYFSSLSVNSGGRLRTAHSNGLYSGTAAPSTIYSQIGLSYRMSYYLNANSTVEYYGSDTQIITGTGLGMALTTNHRYGRLEINFQGTPDVEFAYPADNFVYVKTALVLTAGELNLDNDHATSTGGRQFNVLNGATITRVNGYIRSETEDGSGALSWNISTLGSYVIPFGYSSSEYIPFTYQPTAGNSGDVVLATYRSAIDNSPFPPTVTHVRDVAGADNSGSTVDRFWRISVPGSVIASITFSSTNSERSGIVNPRAQLWEPVSLGWFLPSGVQSNPTISTTLASGITGLNNWWTLSSASSPLPIELISFEAAVVNGTQVRLDWSTASEINNDYFTVQRSADGIHFSDLITIDGAGNSTSLIAYKTFDQEPVNGLNYYRLKQTDFDGAESLSQVRMVSFKKKSKVSVYPNPFVGSVISINTDGDSELITTVSVYDLAGKLISKIDAGSSTFTRGMTEINLGNKLEQGAYMVEINTTQGVYRERIIKQ